jgi:hypothetical protein
VSILSDLNPQAILAQAAIVGLLAGGAYLYGHHNGYASEKAAYDLYVSQQAQKGETQLADNKAALLFQQTQFDLQQTKLVKEHQDQIDSLTAARDAAVNNGAVWSERLRSYLAAAHTRAGAPGVPAASTGTGQPPADSQSQGGLLDGVSSLNWWLTQRFHTADVNATTLNEAIDLIAQDRATCNGALPGVTK